MRQGASPGYLASALSPWPRTECTTGGAGTLWSGYSGLPLQPIWKTGARSQLGDPTHPQVSAHAVSIKFLQHGLLRPSPGAGRLLHWLRLMMDIYQPGRAPFPLQGPHLME